MIASINGTPVSAAELEQESKTIMAHYQQQIPPEQLNAMQPEIQKQAIESIINRRLLIDEVERQNIALNSNRVKQEIDAIAARFPSRDAFEDQLKANGISMDQMEKDLGQQIRIDTMIQDHVKAKDIQVNEEEAKGFYEANPDSFKSQEQVRASHILLKVDANSSDDFKSQKRLELAGILGQIEKGADFSQMAQQHSDCPSKQKGGDLGSFGKGSMVKPFEEAVFKMTPGELSDIVETDFGYHIIKLTEKSEAGTVAFNDVKDQIIQHLLGQKQQGEFHNLIQDLRKNADIQYGDELK